MWLFTVYCTNHIILRHSKDNNVSTITIRNKSLRKNKFRNFSDYHVNDKLRKPSFHKLKNDETRNKTNEMIHSSQRLYSEMNSEQQPSLEHQNHSKLIWKTHRNTHISNIFAFGISPKLSILIYNLNYISFVSLGYVH